MKKHFFKIAMSLLLVGSLFFTNSAKAQVEKGSILIEPYYGLLSTGKALLTAYNQTGTSTSSSSMGPAGLRFSYMINEKVGLGFDGNYQSMSFEYTDGTYNYTVSRDVMRFMINAHFIFLNEDSFQLFGNVGTGYRDASWKFTSDDPNYVEDTLSGFIPVAFRLTAGAKYMFTDNIGAFVELSIGGGSYTNGGLTIAL